jgi:hypothetical protein
MSSEGNATPAAADAGSSAESVAADAANSEQAEANASAEGSEDSSDAEGAEGLEGQEASEDLTTKEKKAVDNLKRKLKLKVDGQEIEEEIDLSNDEYLTKNLQKAKAFDKKAQEAATLRKEMASLLELLQSNPVAVMEQLGMNFDEFAYKHLESKIEELSKSPEQLEREKMEKELSELREEKKKLAAEKEKAVQEQMRNEEAARVENEIISALNAHNGILSAEDPTAIADISRAMLRAMQKGFLDVTVQDVIPVVEKQYAEKLQKRIGTLSKKDAALVEQLLGKDLFEDARKRRVGQKRKAQIETAKQVVKDTGAAASPKEEKTEEKRSYRSFFKPY